eukprot:CAMPEP_0174323416 /NCGR_PEP_ID=MMETSP0810-20121108/11792_1 /TAXON_ID=73025 ORGANISM="Eutreptiella gymnastica-like, Strain CCMP1594" /NCGR_SAMPLE_ID=MMETSP0810 /ASSEMBLY_ACC=CAM_ASM_000659 /LENGTH=38 /DNA_ID= /DNA_START= /DNA_END= /DNA_ORIENTATION=
MPQCRESREPETAATRIDVNDQLFSGPLGSVVLSVEGR